MQRRTFLKQTAYGLPALSANLHAATDNIEPMKIARIDAVNFP
jgi:hypothetical protein